MQIVFFATLLRRDKADKKTATKSKEKKKITETGCKILQFLTEMMTYFLSGHIEDTALFPVVGINMSPNGQLPKA